jgi:glycine oxidase
MQPSPDVAIVGGGIIGLTAAVYLAEAGRRVVVFDRAEVGREASWAGAGIIPPGDPATARDPIDVLRSIGSVRLPDFAAALTRNTGQETGYRRNGGIEFLSLADEYAVPLWEQQRLRFEVLDPSRLSQFEPHLRPPAETAYYLPDMAQVRNPWYLRAITAEAVGLGVRLETGCPVEDVHPRQGVRLADGRTVSAGQYVIAAGAWAGHLLNRLGCELPVRPVRGQIVLYRQVSPTVTRTLILGKEYIVPRGDGRVLIGSTEEPDAGFENQTTVDGQLALQRFATSLVPGLITASVEAGWAGLRPGSVDGRPYIGPVPGVEGVFAAVGHFRAGVQLSIGTADLLRHLLLGTQTQVPTAPFTLDRRPDTTSRPAFRS